MIYLEKTDRAAVEIRIEKSALGELKTKVDSLISRQVDQLPLSTTFGPEASKVFEGRSLRVQPAEDTFMAKSASGESVLHIDADDLAYLAEQIAGAEKHGHFAPAEFVILSTFGKHKNVHTYLILEDRSP